MDKVKFNISHRPQCHNVHIYQCHPHKYHYHKYHYQCDQQAPDGELLGAKALHLMFITNSGDDAQEVFSGLLSLNVNMIWVDLGAKSLDQPDPQQRRHC